MEVFEAVSRRHSIGTANVRRVEGAAGGDEPFERVE